jgi:hypothetical protein
MTLKTGLMMKYYVWWSMTRTSKKNRLLCHRLKWGHRALPFQIILTHKKSHLVRSKICTMRLVGVQRPTRLTNYLSQLISIQSYKRMQLRRGGETMRNPCIGAMRSLVLPNQESPGLRTQLGAAEGLKYLLSCRRIPRQSAKISKST